MLPSPLKTSLCHCPCRQKCRLRRASALTGGCDARGGSVPHSTSGLSGSQGPLGPQGQKTLLSPRERNYTAFERHPTCVAKMHSLLKFKKPGSLGTRTQIPHSNKTPALRGTLLSTKILSHPDAAFVQSPTKEAQPAPGRRRAGYSHQEGCSRLDNGKAH